MKLFIKTFGCAFNQRDSENIAGALVESGFELVDAMADADAVIVNSCGVKGSTHNKVINFIKAVPAEKVVFVGGCLTRMIDIKKLCSNVSAVFDVNSIEKVVDVIKGRKSFFSDSKEFRLGRPLVRKNKNTAIIPIAQGCLGEPCSYCSVWFARGSLKSYPSDAILKELQSAVSEGCSTIYFTAQDTGCYGKDSGDSLPNLLKRAVKIDGNFRIRVGMMNPNFAIEYLDELINVFMDDKIMKFLHIPLQSGSDKVLKDMRRKYSAEDFVKVVGKFRKKLPGITISTDIIVGYPTESEWDFLETLRILKKVKPEVVNLSKFAPRPGTYAAQLKQLDGKEIKRRSVEAHKVAKLISKQTP